MSNFDNKPFTVDGRGSQYVMKRLKSGEYTIKPITVKKTWEFTSNSGSINYYQNFNIQPLRFLYPENHKYFGNVTNISSSLYERSFTSQSLDPKLLWYYLDHNYYTDYLREKVPTVVTDFTLEKYLSESGSMFLIPRSCMGEGLTKKSIELTNINVTTASLNYSLKDDGYGNLIDTTIDNTKIIDKNYLMLYFGFNEKYRERDFKKKRTDYVLDYSPNDNNISIINHKNISYTAGIPLTDATGSTGLSAILNGAYFSVKEKDKFNFNYQDNFAFSFWVNIPVSQSNTQYDYNCLFSKNTIAKKDVLNQTTKYDNATDVFEVTDDGVITRNKIETIDDTWISNRYPFDITITNQNNTNPHVIKFKQSSVNKTNEVTSSILTTGEWHHIVCQRSSSNLQIWIDGNLDADVTGSNLSYITNTHNFYIAGNGFGSGSFSGSLDEVRIYNKGLNSNEISNLYDNSFQYGYAYQSSRVGNVFYNEGIMTISDPRPKYANAFLGKDGNFDYYVTDYGFEGKFKSQVTFYEHEIICKLRKHEFNFTQNPTIRTNREKETSLIENYVTSSYFNPYITTIGLYNDSQELVAVAKLANPTAKRDDVDMNFIIRFDV
jgi:hypothetical protein